MFWACSLIKKPRKGIKKITQGNQKECQEGLTTSKMDRSSHAGKEDGKRVAVRKIQAQECVEENYSQRKTVTNLYSANK